MNERIKALAEQAGFHFHDMHDVDGQDSGETIEADDWNAAQKFAELIVKECALQLAQLIVKECAMFVVAELEGQVGSRIADTTANNLEEHFGVAE